MPFTRWSFLSKLLTQRFDYDVLIFISFPVILEVKKTVHRKCLQTEMSPFSRKGRLGHSLVFYFYARNKRQQMPNYQEE